MRMDPWLLLLCMQRKGERKKDKRQISRRTIAGDGARRTTERSNVVKVRSVDAISRGGGGQRPFVHYTNHEASL